MVHNLKRYRSDDYEYCKLHDYMTQYPNLKNPTDREKEALEVASDHIQWMSTQYRAFREQRDNLQQHQKILVIDGTSHLLAGAPEARAKDLIIIEILRTTSGTLQFRKYDFLHTSKNDAKIVQTALCILLGVAPEGSQSLKHNDSNVKVTDLFLWSDNGPPFKTAKIWLFLGWLKVHTQMNIVWQYFWAHHGKNLADIAAADEKKQLRDWTRIGKVPRSMEDLKDLIEQIGGKSIILKEALSLKFLQKELSTKFPDKIDSWNYIKVERADIFHCKTCSDPNLGTECKQTVANVGQLVEYSFEKYPLLPERSSGKPTLNIY